MKGLLDGVPIFFAQKYAIGAWAGDEHRLVGGGRFIEEPVQLLAGLAGIHGVHVCQRTLFRTCRQAKVGISPSPAKAGCPTHSRFSNEWETDLGVEYRRSGGPGLALFEIREVRHRSLAQCARNHSTRQPLVLPQRSGAPGLALFETWEVRHRSLA